MTTSTHHQAQSPAASAHRHSHPVLEAIISVSRCAEFLRTQVDKAVAPLSITGVQYNILRVLKRAHPEGLSRSEVLRELIEKSVDVTRSIDGLIKLGYVERTRPETDRRLSVTTITNKGIQALSEVDPYFYQMMQKMGSTLSESEFRQLAELCRKLEQSNSE
jgi:DNA-binding MarR family transcriptional regulator